MLSLFMAVIRRKRRRYTDSSTRCEQTVKDGRMSSTMKEWSGFFNQPAKRVETLYTRPVVDTTFPRNMAGDTTVIMDVTTHCTIEDNNINNKHANK